MNQSEKKITIAVDGHSACGKSTLAKDLAKALEYLYIDSGAMYRAVTLFFLNEGVSLSDKGQVEEALSRIALRFQKNGGQNQIHLNGEPVEDKIRSREVNSRVSDVAAIPAVRRAMVHQQQEIGKNKGIVMDGRDIGTVVFPAAELKIFLTADLETRVYRRYLEMIERGIRMTEDEVRENLVQRDHIDTTREDSPLVKAEDAVVIDNTHLTRKEQAVLAYGMAKEKIEGSG